MINAHTIGSKYAETEHLDVAEIAKLIRRDIKSAFPGVKTSVRISRFSMGRSIDVAITSWSGELHNRARIRDDIAGRRVSHAWMSDAAIELQNAIAAVVAAYNFDNSDLSTDYHHSKFYSSVSFARDDRERVEAIVRAEIEAERAVAVAMLTVDTTTANDVCDEWSSIASAL